MNSIKYFISLLIFSSFSFTNPVETGHANVSIVKFDTDSSLKNELFIGIKMDMQKNWHTYWKNPGDSGGRNNENFESYAPASGLPKWEIKTIFEFCFLRY